MSNADEQRIRLNAEAIRHRLRDHVYSVYLSYGYHVKGAVLASAGLSLYLILTQALPSSRLERASFWLVSLIFSGVTVSTWNRESVLTNAHANGWDFVLPLFTGVSEVLMFVVLSPFTGEPANRWLDWYLVFAVFSFCASFLILNRRIQTRDKEFELGCAGSTLLNEYRKWLLKDLIGAFIFGVISGLLWLLLRRYPESLAGVHLTIAGMLVVFGGFKIYNSGFQYRTLASI